MLTEQDKKEFAFIVNQLLYCKARSYRRGIGHGFAEALKFLTGHPDTTPMELGEHISKGGLIQ